MPLTLPHSVPDSLPESSYYPIPSSLFFPFLHDQSPVLLLPTHSTLQPPGLIAFARICASDDPAQSRVTTPEQQGRLKLQPYFEEKPTGKHIRTFPRTHRQPHWIRF
jgi:hypothetical protein